MRILGRFNQLGKDFTIKYNVLNTNSNHNIFVHLFQSGEKQPLAGTSFADGTSREDIILWGKKTIGEMQTNEFVDEVFKDVNLTPHTAEERWPELNTIATPMFEQVIKKINAIKINDIETDCPYIRQGVLEMVISKLEKCV